MYFHPLEYECIVICHAVLMIKTMFLCETNGQRRGTPRKLRVVEGRPGTHEAVSREGHEWGGRNGFLAEVQLGYDLTVTRFSKNPYPLILNVGCVFFSASFNYTLPVDFQQ